MSELSFGRASMRASRTKRFGVRGTAAMLGLIGTTFISSSFAQAPPFLGTLDDFAVLGGSTVTNTGPTVISGTATNPGHVGVSPGGAIVGFPPGVVTAPGTFHGADAVAAQAQIDLTTAYNNLSGRPSATNLTGQDLGGMTLVPGVYNFNSSAQLTGVLRLNALGNPNAVFIINIESTLTTASNSSVLLINGAQGGNVFWRVGTSATLGTNTAFAGDILALTSITLNTGASITCGAAWARNGAVTLDTNTISICALLVAGTDPVVLPDGTTVLPDGTSILPDGTVIQAVIGPAGFPLFAFLLPPTANRSQRAVAVAFDTSISNGVTVPLQLINLFNLPPNQLASAFSQLQGEAGTGAAQAGMQAMNSFLSLVTNPFAANRPFAQPRGPMVVKALGYAPQSPQPPGSSASAWLRGPYGGGRSWGIWAAAYGGENKTSGDPVFAGSHDRTARTFGFATGLDYLLTPYTVVGFALGGGGTNFGISEGYGVGRSDMFQASVYSITRYNAAYISGAIAYAWHRASTYRVLTLLGNEQLNADFSANSIGGRIEGGYRFPIPGMFGWHGFGLTPYAALQAQAFRTPSYREVSSEIDSAFALAYSARTTTGVRSELGVWFDRAVALDSGAVLALRTRAAWAHDRWSDPSITASFLALPGASFVEFGAEPARDSLLVSASAEISLRNGISVAGKFDSELARHSQTYIGTARLRYVW